MKHQLLVAMVCILGIGAMIAMAVELAKPVVDAPTTVNLGADMKIVGSILPLRNRVVYPEWATREIETTLARYRAWKGDDVTVAFPVITDVHSNKYDLPEDLSVFSDAKMHTLFAQMAGEKGKADFIADLGDLDLDIGKAVSNDWPPKFEFCTNEEMERRVAIQVALYSETPLPVLCAVGNHDHSANRFSNERFGEAFNKGITIRKGIKLELGPHGDYGWYDVAGKNVRAIFLNTSEEDYYGFSVEQLQFLVRALDSMPAGWTAVILQHFCTQVEIGHWASFPETKAKRQEIAIRILEDFAAKKAGEADGIIWNFTAMQERWLAGCICGDSHFDNYGKFNGVDYSISQGYGTIRDADMIPGAVKTSTFNRNEQMLIDFVAIKTATREVRIFRIGMGGAERDRGYNY